MNGKTILVGCSTIIVVSLLAFCINWLLNSVWYSPSKLFEKRFCFTLPESAMIENHKYDYQILGEDHFFMKALFDENDYSYLNDSILVYYANSTISNPEELISFYTRSCFWWDMKKSEIVESYAASRPAKHIYSKSALFTFAFITQNADGQYFLYVSY